MFKTCHIGRSCGDLKQEVFLSFLEHTSCDVIIIGKTKITSKQEFSCHFFTYILNKLGELFRFLSL